MVGHAAHIHAAAPGPGARRYVATMTPEERSNIGNAIWLCAHHATLIDRDETTYTADFLRTMKLENEEACRRALEAGRHARHLSSALIAVGPALLCVGELLGSDEKEWRLAIDHFVEGDMHGLISFIEAFASIPVPDRYVLIDALGDGRSLRSAPSWTMLDGRPVLRCPVLPSFPRIEGDRLLADLALSPGRDLMVDDKGNIATVSGMLALPQKIRLAMAIRRGDYIWNMKYGSRLADYYELLRGTPWLEAFIKLELIRIAAIPLQQVVPDKWDTPLQCVERVVRVSILGETSEDGCLPVAVDLVVTGIGSWSCELPVLVGSRTGGAGIV